MSRHRSAWRNRIEFSLYRFGRMLVSILSPSASAAFGGMVGALYYRLSTRRRRIIDFNLSLGFPELEEHERRRLAGDVSRHFGRVTLDALRIQGLTPEELQADVAIEGEEHLRSAIERDEGFFLLSAHLGSWEVAALIAGLLIPGGISVIHRPLDNPLLDAELERLRAVFGNRALGKKNISREVIGGIGSGGVIGILIDQRPHGIDLEVPFFGHPARTHPILARFVRKTRAPVVPIFGYWDAPARYTVCFGELIDPAALEPAELEDAPLTARFMAVTEAAIRRRPEQWLWYHDRWRQLRQSS